jgi:hypothetical protein
MRSLEARLKWVEQKVEERLSPRKNRPFLLSDLSQEQAQALAGRYRRACEVFFSEFGGKPPVAPARALPIHEELRYWVQKSVNIFIAFISALGRGGIQNEEMIERARAVPELLPWVEMAESCIRKRARG